MTDKLEALSQPVGLVTNQLDGAVIVESDQLLPGDNVYSQEYVTALLAELEETRNTLKNVTECWNDEYQRNKELKTAPEEKNQCIEALHQQAVKDGKIIHRTACACDACWVQAGACRVNTKNAACME